MLGLERTNWLTNLIIIQIYSYRIFKYFYTILKGAYSVLTNTSELYRICDRKASELGLQDYNVEMQDPVSLLKDATTLDGKVSNEMVKDPQNIAAQDEVKPEDAPFEQFYSSIVKLAKETRLDAETLYRMDLCILHSTELDDFRNKFESWYSLFDRDPMIYVEPGQGQKFRQLFQEIAAIKHFQLTPTTITKQSIVLFSGLTQVFATMQLLHELNSRASTRYDVNLVQNEEKLMELWAALTDEKLEFRFTKQWQKIGFQGSDPSTDFRAMGMLALDNLHYFATKYSEIN